MIKFRLAGELNETFDTKPERFTNHRSSDNEAEYRFNIGDVRYDVFFDRGGDDTWDVSFLSQQGQGFGSKRTIGLSGTGNQYKVLNTVIAIIAKFVKDRKEDVKRLVVEAQKPYGETGKDNARAKIYRRLVQKKLSSFPGKWDVKEKETSRSFKFILERK